MSYRNGRIWGAKAVVVMPEETTLIKIERTRKFVAEESDVTPSDDASDFVLLSEAVPDAILEIRYYSTYNFVGDRIAGYEEPVALLTKEAAAALRAQPRQHGRSHAIRYDHGEVDDPGRRDHCCRPV